jgi:SOS-response transcriptional repressor LexA
MMEGEVYADFALLWLIAHQSRFEGERPEDSWLERWSKEARERGTRALEGLRSGVTSAIAALGRGFLDPANAELRERLRSGALDRQDYYRELLRLVYRLIFLFAAEDRELLLAPGAGPEARARYLEHYSTRRLRRLADRVRGTPHRDLYCGLRVVMERLGDDRGCPALALAPLGSFLWSSACLPHLGRAEIRNRDFLEAIRALAFTTDGCVRRPVDYKNLGAEELGSVYESLLELHPEIHLEAGVFELKTASGHERKTTGSYYTPESLIQCLLDSALEPVIAEALAAEDPERALLALKVCDPASGSGHFLIAAAHRLARRLAALRTGDAEPAPGALRTALRDVIGRSIYGVDSNPMAVELCKVSLWLEALEPGKPLSFLERRIVCGNSLLGATPALIAKGVPDEAFEPIEGDDRKHASALKKRNRQARRDRSSGQGEFDFAGGPGGLHRSVAAAVEDIESLGDASIAAIREREARYARLVESPEYRRQLQRADAWCAAFVWKKARDAPEAPTQDVFERLDRDPGAVGKATLDEIERLARRYQWLHLELTYTAWDLAPFARDLGWDGSPFRWDEERRFLLRCEIDAAFFHLYGIAREDAEYILETFPIVRRNDERAHGEYRTKRLILEIYDALAEAERSGSPYRTRLDPPPADPAAAHPPPEAAPAAAASEPPFERVEPEETEKHVTCVPLFTLKAAAGAFGDAQSVEPDGWVRPRTARPLAKGIFVARVEGRSMEPRIPDGAYCLFSAPVAGTRQGKIVLAQHHSIHDPETGGAYTVKRYRSEKTPAAGPDDAWRHQRIVLEPLNPDYEPIVLDDDPERPVRVIAELIDVLGR